ncbi:hypothetical protein [Pseudomonas sp. CGJS7]|uniref:hypothetical protein n=1 Tax=Pseudomonas sp. CGJS7 TaxID=3109348 RepID=UPI00300865A4
MKRLLCSLLLCVCLPASAAEAMQPVVDPVIDAVFKSLAQRYRYNLVSMPDDSNAQIGKVYYVTEPACASALTRMAETGAAMQVFEALSLREDEVPASAARTQWTSIRFASVLSKGATGELFARLPERKGEIKLALEALQRTNAQVQFGIRQVGSVSIKRAMDKELRRQQVVGPADLGNDARGAIAPHAELVLQKFEYDKQGASGRKGSVLLGFMELFGARLDASKNVQHAYGYQLPTYSILAFKPVTALFEPGACQRQAGDKDDRNPAPAHAP